MKKYLSGNPPRQYLSNFSDAPISSAVNTCSSAPAAGERISVFQRSQNNPLSKEEGNRRRFRGDIIVDARHRAWRWGRVNGVERYDVLSEMRRVYRRVSGFRLENPPPRTVQPQHFYEKMVSTPACLRGSSAFPIPSAFDFESHNWLWTKGCSAMDFYLPICFSNFHPLRGWLPRGNSTISFLFGDNYIIIIDRIIMGGGDY